MYKSCMVYVIICHICVSLSPGTYVLKSAIKVTKPKKHGGMHKTRSEPLFLAELRNSQPQAPSIPNKHQSFGCVCACVCLSTLHHHIVRITPSTIIGLIKNPFHSTIFPSFFFSLSWQLRRG